MQREESIDAQLRAIHDYAERNNMVIVAEYIDRAKSATSDQRPEFQRMVKDSNDSLFDVVIVHKLDRFARNRYDSAHYKHILKRNGVVLRSVVENLDDSPESIVLESVLEGMAEYYSQNLAREVMKGLTENALKGIHTGGIPPFGYDVDPTTKKLVLNEREAVGVRMIFQKTIEGVGYTDIINELNALGFRGKRGQVFAKNSICSILRNPKYTGDYYYNRSKSKDIDGKRSGYKDESEFIIIKDAIPAIVSREDYARAKEKQQGRMHTRKHSHAKEEYILTGKMVCGECGGSYVGARRMRSKDGSYWVAYGCNRRYRTKSYGCNNKEISKTFIEKCVLDKLSEYVFSDECAEKITAEYNTYLKTQNSESFEAVRKLQADLKKVTAETDTIANLLIQMQSTTLMQKLEDAEKRKLRIESELAIQQAAGKIDSVDIDELKAVFIQIAEELQSGSLTNAKQIINMYVNRIEVFPDKAIVYLNFFPNITIDYSILSKQEDTGEELNKHEKNEDCAPTQSSAFTNQLNVDFADDWNGEGEVRTPAPVTRPTPLAGAPLQPT